MTASNDSTPNWQTLHQMVRKAQQKLNLDAWDYIAGGTETETTLKRNRYALDAIGFRPRVLRDVSQTTANTKAFERTLRLPVCLAPVGSLELFDPQGAVAATKAAEAFGCYSMLSSVCKPDLAAVAEAAPDANRWYQLYVHGDARWIDEKVEAVQTHGYCGMVLTVDSAVYSRRERDIAKDNTRRVGVPGREHQAQLTWKDIARIRARTSIPLGLKGIMTAEDAEIAIDHGIDLVYVSNHGGRQLDHGMGTLDALPEIARAVKGQVPVWIDGGFCRGTDIVKAKILGADVVGLGRLQCWALAAGGIPGAVRMLELLEIEIKQCMSLLGMTDWATGDPAMLQAAPVVTSPSVYSAFPLLDTRSADWY